MACMALTPWLTLANVVAFAEAFSVLSTLLCVASSYGNKTKPQYDPDVLWHGCNRPLGRPTSL